MILEQVSQCNRRQRDFHLRFTVLNPIHIGHLVILPSYGVITICSDLEIATASAFLW